MARIATEPGDFLGNVRRSSITGAEKSHLSQAHSREFFSQSAPNSE